VLAGWLVFTQDRRAPSRETDPPPTAHCCCAARASTHQEYQGFTVIPDAIPQPLLGEVQAAFHAAAAAATPGTLEFAGPLHKQTAAVVDDDGVVEITQPYEHHPSLQKMLELPKPMAVLEALLGEPVRSLRHVHGDRVVHRPCPDGSDDCGGGDRCALVLLDER
jgi:hypothetical protein